MKTCSAKVTELEGNIQGVSNLFDNLKVECKTNKDQITKVSKICDKNQNDIKKVSTKLELVQANISTQSCNCEEDIESLKSTVLDLQCRSMKNNLIFTGLHEVSNEYTEDLLRDVLYSELGIDYKIEFGNVYRFGRNACGRRPIVARFVYFADLQHVLDSAYKLRNRPFGIKQQFPQEIENRRKQLYSIQRNAKREGKRVTLVRDRLYINNELYIVPEEIELNEMQEDAFEIDQGNLEDDFIPYRYTNRADHRPPK